MVLVRYRLNDQFVEYLDFSNSLVLHTRIPTHELLVYSIFKIPKMGVLRGDSHNFIEDTVFFFYDKAILKTFLSKFYLFFTGFNYGFYVEMITVGVGYRFERLYRDSNILTMNLGYSHLIYYKIPAQISFRVSKNYLLLFGVDYTEIRTLAKKIRSYRIPDLYKGKGIRYLGEVIPLKVGKQRQR